MNEGLMRLLALDRLVELIGEGRIREIAARRLDDIEILAALGDDFVVDKARLRGLLLGETRGPEPFKGTLETYFEEIVNLLELRTEDQLHTGIEPALNQMWIGWHTMKWQAPPGKSPTVGFCAAECLLPVSGDDSIQGELKVRERYVIRDKDVWLNGTASIQVKRTTPYGLANQTDRAEADLKKEKDKTNTPGWHFSIEFNYGSLLEVNTVELAAALPRPEAESRVLFTVKSDNNIKGALLREVFPGTAGPRVLDHWFLQHDYQAPGKKGVTLVPGALRSDECWAEFRRQVDEYWSKGVQSREDQPAGSRDSRGWYIPTLYTMTPL